MHTCTRTRTHTHMHTKFKANGLHYMVYSEHGILIKLRVWDVFNPSCLGAALVLVRKDAVIVIIQIKPRVNYGRRKIINILQRLLPSRLPEVALLIKASEAEDSLLNILYSTEVKCP